MPNREYSVEEQAQVFSGFWTKFSQQIKDNDGKVDFPSGSELLPRHVTTIIRLPDGMAKRLQSDFADICPDDYHYPFGDIHLTLINLDKLLGEQENIDWQALGKRISGYVHELSPLELQIKGINVFPTTIFIEVYDQTGALEMYRRAILQGVSSYLSENINLESHTALVPGIAFANIVRFKHNPSPSIVASIEQKRDMHIGTFTPAAFEVVTTNRLLSRDGTIVNAIIPMQS
jgi:hypothetical protein